MRLNENQRQAIVESVRCAFGPAAKTYLFGSRVDDGKYGGDIDLLVEVRMPKREWLDPTIRAVSMIQRRIGERKIDLVVTDSSPKVTQTVQTLNLLYSRIDRFLDLYRTARASCVTRLSALTS